MKLTERLLGNLETYLLIIAIIAGQLIKIPLGLGGLTLLDLTVLVFCLLGILKLRFNFKKPPNFILAAFIFTIIAGISLIFTPIHLNFSNFLSSSFYLIRFFLYILFGYLIYLNAFPLLKEKTSEILILSGFGLALLGLLQFIFIPNLLFLQSQGWDPHYFRTVSSLLDPNFAGAFFVLTLLVIYSKRYIFNLKWLAILVGTVFFSLLTTFSRSSYLMFLVTFICLSFFERSKKLALMTLIAFVTLTTFYYADNKIIAQPHGVNRTQSASFRLNTWQQGLKLFLKYPILGVGFNTYHFALEQQNLADQEFLNSRGSTSNDSSLLFIASTTGIIGLITFLLFIWTLQLDSLLLKATLCGLLIHSFFANSLFYPFILLWLVLMAAAGSSKEKSFKKS